MPNRSATRRARGSSFTASSANPIEKVLTGSRDCSAIAATTAEESIPPERKAPTGTSATRRRPTAARSDSRIRSCSSAVSPTASFSA